MGIDYAQIGYCTNVHAGADLDTTRANLEKYALAVKARISPRFPMGIGLWLSASAAERLLRDRQVGAFAAWLHDAGLVPYTFNGFPHGDFHQAVVKHRVYHPTWWEPARLEYTLDLVAIQHALLPEGLAGSISTLPIAWGQPAPSHEQLTQAAVQLRKVAERLERLERETGRFICLCLEPEPGCVLQRSRDVVNFFHRYLWPERDAEAVRRYLQVCHDVCHAAVMFETQEEVLRTYQTAAIGVGKVQVSSAVATPLLGPLAAAERQAVVGQLAEFREERYLHQTVIRDDPAEPPEFFEDLPQALAERAADAGTGEWRVHFHVPIYLERFGHLRATRGDIRECLTAARHLTSCRHFEVETYAWGVLPPELREPDLAAGIARELEWYVNLLRVDGRAAGDEVAS